MNPIEEIFVKSFVAPDKQARWLALLPSSKNRDKLIVRLSGLSRADLDPKFTFAKDALPSSIAAAMQRILADSKKTNPNQVCHIIGGSQWDGQRMPLSEAEVNEFLTTGALIILVPDRLAYYQTDRQPYKTNWFVLVRP